jgi:predicted small lipoprotein YifL
MKNLLSACSLTVLLLSLTACGKSPAPAEMAAETKVSTGHTHESWWCSEHGVPEEVCAQCNPKLVAKFKADGDWCQKHDCPDSQCFICHPENEAKFAKLYEEKIGKQPPKRGS